jgi:hypothetical protein
MKTIRISDQVWEAIAERGKFGETEEDVLRRVFNLPKNTNDETHLSSGKGTSPNRAPSGHRRSFASQRMSSYIDRNGLHLEFQGGANSSWMLPDPSDKVGIRAVLDKAIEFARANGASFGQVMAVRKALTSGGYYLTK